jgi:outer membrane protein assembly factor BamA
MKKFTTRRILTLAVFLVAVGCHRTVQTNLPNLSNGAFIESIQVAGNRAISSEVILAKFQTKAGDKINTAVIQRDIVNVRSLGCEDVRVNEENGTSGGKIVVFTVREKPPRPTH